MDAVFRNPVVLDVIGRMVISGLRATADRLEDFLDRRGV